MKEKQKDINEPKDADLEKELEEIKKKIDEVSSSEIHIEHEPKHDKTNSELELLTKELADYKDKFIRKVAEFENYKRRTENEQMNLFKYAAETFLTKLLPVVDDFERSLKHINDAVEINAVKEGIQLIYDKMMKLLDDQGVKKIEATGKPFDVHYHEAVMQRPAEGVEPHTVLDEIQTGYMFKDKVIRHSMVIVSEDRTINDKTGNNSEDPNMENKN
jgi:molecular chaperone GrpE